MKKSDSLRQRGAPARGRAGGRATNERTRPHKPARRSRPAPPQPRPGWQIPRTEWIILGVLVVSAFAIRIYKVGVFPDTVLGDEADTVQNAARIVYGRPPANGFFGLDWSQNPAFSIYKQAAFLAIFGFNVAAMRLPGALISALALIPFYLLLRRQVSRLPAVMATILLATDVWYLNFSRSGWILIDIAFYMLLAMLLLMWAVDAAASPGQDRRTTLTLFALAGLAACLGLYGYTAGRAITVAIVAFVPVAVLFHRSHARQLLVGFAVLLGIEALLFAPQALYISRIWNEFNTRTNVVFIGNSPAFKADPAGTMWRQIERNVRGPWDGSVNNTPQYTPVGEPQLDTVSGILALIGMALTLGLRRFRGRLETWLWWLMLLAGWGATQLTTVNTPNGARGIGYMPTLIYFTGLSLDWLLGWANSLSANPASPWRRWMVPSALLGAVILIAGVFNVKHYVDWQSQPGTRQARYLYLTVREFPLWAADIHDRAINNGNITNVGMWRQAYPIADTANP